MKTIKIFNIDNAIDCIWENNLLAEFEEEIAEIPEGSCFKDVIEEEGITLEQLVDFLNKNSDNEKYEIA